MRWPALLLAITILSPPIAVADRPLAETLSARSKACQSTVCVPGRYQFRYLRNTDFEVDRAGTRHGIVDVGEQLWRIRPRININQKLYIEAEADLISGQLFGDTTHIGQDFLLEDGATLDAFGVPSAASFRQLYVHWETPIGVLRIGQQASHFGYGLVANGGDDEDHDVFDDPNLGDLVERVLFATKPFKPLDNAFGDGFILAGGFDVVFRDDNANLLDGDLAMQGVVSLLWKADWLTAGVYMAFRSQEDEDGDTLDAQAFDVFVEWRHALGDWGKLSVGAELAIVNAQTDRAILEQAPEGVDVLGVGAVFRTKLEVAEFGLDARLEVGFASGDNNRNDDKVRSFSFDPAYHVGMILFREVLGRISANSVELIRNPDVSGQPPKGVELVATNGSVTNAVYLNPVLRWGSDFGLRGAVGLLAAWTVADFIDPWESAQNGGYNTSYLGAPADSHWLGFEVDAGVAYALAVRNAVRFEIGVQIGLFVPGSAFDAPEGGKSLENIGKIRTTFDIAW